MAYKSRLERQAEDEWELERQLEDMRQEAKLRLEHPELYPAPVPVYERPGIDWEDSLSTVVGLAAGAFLWLVIIAVGIWAWRIVF